MNGTDGAKLADFRRCLQILADISHFLGIAGFPRRRSSQKPARNRRFSQKTARNRRILQKPVSPYLEVLQFYCQKFGCHLAGSRRVVQLSFLSLRPFSRSLAKASFENLPFRLFKATFSAKTEQKWGIFLSEKLW